MALVLLFIGVLLIVSGFEGTISELLALLENDLPGYFVWAAAIIAIGLVGYAQDFEGVSNGLLFLVFLVMFISNQGAFSNVAKLVQNPPTPASQVPIVSAADQAAIAAGPTVNTTGGASASSSSTAGGIAGAIGSVAKAIPLIGGLF